MLTLEIRERPHNIRRSVQEERECYQAKGGGR